MAESKEKPKRRPRGRNPARMSKEELRETGFQDVFSGVVKMQIEQNNPLAVRRTLNRLIAAGHTRKEAIELITAVFIQYIGMFGRIAKKDQDNHYNQLLDELK